MISLVTDRNADTGRRTIMIEIDEGDYAEAVFKLNERGKIYDLMVRSGDLSKRLMAIALVVRKLEQKRRKG